MKPAWHALLAPLPPAFVVERKPVVPPELQGQAESAAIAGWESMSVNLSAGDAGMRHLLITLDASGTPISAGDWVVYRSASGGEVTWIHESVGGRLEPDGRFLGTRWRIVAVGPAGGDETQTMEERKSEPSAGEVSTLKALVAEILRRC